MSRKKSSKGKPTGITRKSLEDRVRERFKRHLVDEVIKDSDFIVEGRVLDYLRIWLLEEVLEFLFCRDHNTAEFAAEFSDVMGVMQLLYSCFDMRVHHEVGHVRRAMGRLTPTMSLIGTDEIVDATVGFSQERTLTDRWKRVCGYLKILDEWMADREEGVQRFLLKLEPPEGCVWPQEDDNVEG